MSASDKTLLADDILGRLSSLVCELAEIDAETLSPQTALFRESEFDEDSLDLDSLDALEMLLFISEEFDFDPDEIAESTPRTIGDLVALVTNVLARPVLKET